MIPDTDRAMSGRFLSLPTHAYLLALLAGYLLTLVYVGGMIHVVLTLAAALLIFSLVETPSVIARVLRSQSLVFVRRRTSGIYHIHVLIANSVTMGLNKEHMNRHWF